MTGMRGTILVADDDAGIRTILAQAFHRAGYEVRAAANATMLWQWIAEGLGDVVITDVVMPDGTAFDLLPRIRRSRPQLPVVVMSAQNTFLTAVTASEKGAYDYLPKPFDLHELLRIVERALTDRRQRPAKTPADEPVEAMPLVGRSPAMQEIYRSLARLMQTDLTVLIRGESGTGKELVARALHDYGLRRAGPFIAINMAAIPRDLIESELFGHEKGAFTGAEQRHAGRFQQAEGGTLFLDEIGDMPLDAQTRLLRVLQQGEYMSVGGRAPIRTDVRIIAASHRDLHQLVRQGDFREDLYYRLNVVPIRLPALRERIDDIPALARHFLRQAEEEGLGAKHLAPAAITALQEYRWPGNIRELENLVRRLCVLFPQEEIDSATIRAELGLDAALAPASASESYLAALEHHLQQYLASFGTNLPPPGLYHRILAEIERPLLVTALAATGGNQLRAAELLGLNRNTLRKKMRERGLLPMAPDHARQEG